MTQDPGPKTAEQVIRSLHNFNRKERDHLMKFALSDNPRHPELSDKLWAKVAPELSESDRPKSNRIFIGMDYHLNWLYAALAVSGSYDPDGARDMDNVWPGSAAGNEDSRNRPLRDNQEDVDLLVAIPLSESSLRLVLIEAKLGSGWSSQQFESKIDRLEAIREAASENLAPGLEIEWRLMLASPKDAPPSTHAFAPERLDGADGWYTEVENGLTRPRYFQFGPKRLFQVKRDSASGEKWEIVRVNLAGKGGD
jgi:hypothetical protein